MPVLFVEPAHGSNTALEPRGGGEGLSTARGHGRGARRGAKPSSLPTAALSPTVYPNTKYSNPLKPCLSPVLPISALLPPGPALAFLLHVVRGIRITNLTSKVLFLGREKKTPRFID